MPYQEEHRADVGPADPPEDPRRVAYHLLYVMRETVHTVEPTHPGSFNKHHEQDGDSRAVDVQQVHQVHPALQHDFLEVYSVSIFRQLLNLPGWKIDSEFDVEQLTSTETIRSQT